MNEEVAKTDKINHVCYTRNADGIRTPINFMNGEHCFIPTAKKYWKKTEEPRRKSPRRVVKKSDVAQIESAKN